MLASHLPHEPISNLHGYDRGTPIDRFYINQFLSTHAPAITGVVGELKDGRYFSQFHGESSSLIVLDIDANNPLVDLRVDLTEAGSLPPQSLDCIICTQAVQFFQDPVSAIANMQQSLRPGGTLLFTAPAVGRLSVSIPQQDLWRFNPEGVRGLFRDWSGTIDMVTYGNLSACLAMLIGFSAEEVGEANLSRSDERYPLVTCVAASRPPTARH